MSDSPGFILVETLLALAIFGIVTLSALNFLSSISRVVDQPIRPNLYEKIVQLKQDPVFHETEPSISLLEVTSYEDGPVWKVYRIDASNSNGSIKVPVYYPRVD